MSSAGQEAAELAESAGLFLDPWQRFVLDVSLRERADGRWAAFEVGVVVARQNGKGSIIEARELAGLFLMGEDLLLHSAHEFKTAEEAFRRIRSLIEDTPDLARHVKRVTTSHGQEGIELMSGARLKFVARTGGSGRGFTADLLVLDEAFNLGAESMAALMPTLSARPNPQIWYTSTAAMATSTQLHRLRRRALGLVPGDDRLAYLEWSAADADDADGVEQANPGLGIRIDPDFVEVERRSMPSEIFRRERLGIPDAALDVLDDRVLSEDDWGGCVDVGSQPGDRLAFGVDVSPDRSSTAIAVASRRSDGCVHVEVVRESPGTGWVVDEIVELHRRHKPFGWILDPGSPAGSFIPRLAEHGIVPELVSSRELGQACGALFDAVVQRRLRHLDQARLNVAVAGGKRRSLGDAWAWARRDSSVSIAPLVAATLAFWLADRDTAPPSVELWAAWS